MLKRLRLLAGWVEKRNKVLQSISSLEPQNHIKSEHLVPIIMTSAQNFEPFTFAGQEDVKTFSPLPSAEFPLALRPADGWNPSLQESVEAISRLSSSGELKRLLQRHGGALIIKGLPITTPDDYSKVAHAFGFVAHEEVGRPPIRTVLARNVKTANEG